MIKIAFCVIAESTRDFDIEYSYIIPEKLLDKAAPGMRAKVPFGRSNKLREAFIIRIEESENDDSLKMISSIIGSRPLLTERMIKLTVWMKKRYLCTYYDAIRCIVPQLGASGIKKAKTGKVYLLAADAKDAEVKTSKQKAVLDSMEPGKEYKSSYLCEKAEVSASVLNALVEKGYITSKLIYMDRNPFLNGNIDKTYDLIPTPDQKYVLDRLKTDLHKGVYKEFLLHGITGSGKTEIYIQLIRETLRIGKQAIVLVPEISLTPQMVNGFRSRFNDNIAVLHSRLSQGERYDQWNLIKEGRKDIVIGARSAVFAPLQNLGLIIIDEEHEYSYKSETTPKYSTDEVAREICKLNDSILVLGSATPRVETYFMAKNNEIELLVMKNRTNALEMPPVEIVDMKEELKRGNKKIFSRKLEEEIRNNLSNRKQSIILLNRRGYSTFVLCRDCGYVCKCPHCNISMTYHFNTGYLVCHYCGYAYKSPSICPSCKSKKIRYFGAGTQKLEQEIMNNFPDASVIRMDMDTTGRKNSHEKILDKFRKEKIDILVGTQMVAKGHDFPEVTLVGVLAADSILNFPDFRAGERTFQLITQVAGRAGRGVDKGRVVVQAYNTEDFSILCAAGHDYESFYNKEILIRKELKVPPYKKICQIIFNSKTQNDAKRAAEIFADLLKTLTIEISGFEIFGPLKPPVDKIKDTYRYRIIIKANNYFEITGVLDRALTEYSGHKKEFPSGKMPMAGVDINPYNML